MNNVHPKISIITPSLNQGCFIEQAIKSVLSQNYPNFEHIIVDGRSSDNTLNILKKYPHLKWVSQKDKSHMEAVNRGIKMASGDIITILNSDDFFEINAFKTVFKIFKNQKTYFVCGNCRLVDSKGNFIRISEPHTKFSELLQPWKYEFPLNPSSYFYRRSIHKHLGLYSESVGPAYDYEFILKVVHHCPITKINFTLGNYRVHPNSITCQNQKNTSRDMINIARKYWGPVTSVLYWQMTVNSVLYPVTSYILHIIGMLRTIFAVRTRIKRIITRTIRY